MENGRSKPALQRHGAERPRPDALRAEPIRLRRAPPLLVSVLGRRKLTLRDLMRVSQLWMQEKALFPPFLVPVMCLILTVINQRQLPRRTPNLHMRMRTRSPSSLRRGVRLLMEAGSLPLLSGGIHSSPHRRQSLIVRRLLHPMLTQFQTPSLMPSLPR